MTTLQAQTEPAAGQPPQPAPQQVDQQTQDVATANAQPPAPTGPVPGVHIPYETIPRQYGRDVYKAFGHANDYHGLEQEGWLNAIAMAKQQGLDPTAMVARLSAPAEPPPQVSPPPPPPPPVGQERYVYDPSTGTYWDSYTAQWVQQPDAAAASPSADYVTREEMKQAAIEAAKEAVTEYRTTAEEQADLQARRTAEREAYDEAMAEVLGIQRKPREMSWLGRDGVKVDPEYRRERAMLRDAVQEAWEHTIDHDLPAEEFDKRLNSPIDRDFILRTAAYLKPLRAVAEDDAAARAADRALHDNEPTAALPSSPAGQAARSAAPKTRAEAVDQAMAEDPDLAAKLGG